MATKESQAKWRERSRQGLTGETCDGCGKRLRKESRDGLCFYCWRKTPDGKAFASYQTWKSSQKVDVVAECKKISSKFSKELGFVNSAALNESASKNEVEVIPGIGFVHFHHRRDGQTTIYSLAVLPEHQSQGWGRLLFYRVLGSLVEHRNHSGAGEFNILAKCPENLPSNEFYSHVGFKLTEVEKGKKRKLNIWKYSVNLPLLFYCGAGGRSRYDHIAIGEGWLPGIRSSYSSTPTVHQSMIDNLWGDGYVHEEHLGLIKQHKPLIATVRDIESISQLPEALRQAREISRYCGRVIIIPKVKCWLPPEYWVGFSIPTSHGGCHIEPEWFEDRFVHLLGGDANDQALYAQKLNVVSLDHNAAMRLASFGKAMHQYCSDSGEPVTGGCYESLRVSLKKQKQYWHSDIWDQHNPVQLSIF